MKNIHKPYNLIHKRVIQHQKSNKEKIKKIMSIDNN